MLFSIIRSHLLIVHLNASVLFKKSFPVPMSTSLFSTFLSIRFRVSSLIFMSFIHLQLIIVLDTNYGIILILINVSMEFEQHHLLRMLHQKVSVQCYVKLCLGLQFFSLTNMSVLCQYHFSFLFLMILFILTNLFIYLLCVYIYAFVFL